MTENPAISERTREFLRALAGDNRQQILLLFADGRPRSVGGIAAEVGISQSTASEQLAILRRGGAVRAERQGKTVLYCADGAGISAAMAELQDLLAACCHPSAGAPTASRSPSTRTASGTIQ